MGWYACYTSDLYKSYKGGGGIPHVLLHNRCHVQKGMGITGSIGHMDGSRIGRKLGSNDLSSYWWKVDGIIAPHVSHVAM